MNSHLDKKLTAIWKKLEKVVSGRRKQTKLEQEHVEIWDQVKDPKLRNTIEAVHRQLRTPMDDRKGIDPQEAFTLIHCLGQHAFREASAFLIKIWKKSLKENKIEAMLEITPDFLSLEEWRKEARISPKELEKQLLNRGTEVYLTAGADWLIAKTPPQKTLYLFEFYLSSRNRPPNLAHGNDVLASILEKDSQGKLLEAILSMENQSQTMLSNLGQIIRRNNRLVVSVVEVLPRILNSRDAPLIAAQLVEEIFSTLHTNRGDERRVRCALLARLITGILILPRITNTSTAGLNCALKIGRNLKNTTTDEDLYRDTWVIENLLPQGLKIGNAVHIDLVGARQLALAFERANKGFSAIEILNVTATNMGLQPIGEEGHKTLFSPVKHEDVQGGLLPTDHAIVESRGWAHGENVVVRAKVRKETNV